MNDGTIPTQCAWCTRLYTLDDSGAHLLFNEHEDGSVQPVSLDEATATMCEECQARLLAARNYKKSIRDSDKHIAVKIVKGDANGTALAE